LPDARKAGRARNLTLLRGGQKKSPIVTMITDASLGTVKTVAIELQESLQWH
jgi:hypothetical protein